MSWPGWESYVPPGPIAADDGRVARAPKPTKYRNVKTTVDGITFDSAKEARRWTELLMLAKAGDVRNLQRQYNFALCAPVIEGGFKDINTGQIVGRRVIGTYRADFVYEQSDRGYGGIVWRFVVEDVKGVRTDMYLWKKRHFEAQYGITILET